MPIKIPFRGIIELVSDHDVGKTVAGLGTVYPYKKTIFVDDDVKGDGTVRQMRDQGVEFEDYINLGKMRTEIGDTPTPTQLLQNIVFPTIEKITQKHHEVIIWDTWRIVYQSARGHVEKNQDKFRDVVKWQGNSVMIQGLISKVARMIEQAQLNKLREACDLLIITHHMKDNYQKNVVVGRIPESSATFSEVANMRIWLRRNPSAKVPIMLFLKRPNQPKVIKGEMRFVNIVPMKIIPTAKDQSIWDAIKRYEDDPIESREPTANEKPSEEEMALISGTLSSEQKSYLMEMLKYQSDTEEAISTIMNEDEEEIEKDRIPSNGVDLIELMKENGWEFSLPQVRKILGKPDWKLKDFAIEDWLKIKEHFEE